MIHFQLQTGIYVVQTLNLEVNQIRQNQLTLWSRWMGSMKFDKIKNLSLIVLDFNQETVRMSYELEISKGMQ